MSKRIGGASSIDAYPRRHSRWRLPVNLGTSSIRHFVYWNGRYDNMMTYMRLKLLFSYQFKV